MIESSTSLKRKKFLALEFLTRQLAARNWVEQILGTSLGNESLNKALHDGVSLCRIVQKASPDSLPRFNEKPRHSAHERENFVYFNEAVKKAYHMDPYVYIPADVVNETFPVRFVDLILVLARRISDYSSDRIKFKIDLEHARETIDVSEEEIMDAIDLVKKENMLSIDSIDGEKKSTEDERVRTNRENEEKERRMKSAKLLSDEWEEKLRRIKALEELKLRQIQNEKIRAMNGLLIHNWFRRMLDRKRANCESERRKMLQKEDELKAAKAIQMSWLNFCKKQNGVIEMKNRNSSKIEKEAANTITSERRKELAKRNAYEELQRKKKEIADSEFRMAEVIQGEWKNKEKKESAFRMLLEKRRENERIEKEKAKKISDFWRKCEEIRNSRAALEELRKEEEARAKRMDDLLSRKIAAELKKKEERKKRLEEERKRIAQVAQEFDQKQKEEEIEKQKSAESLAMQEEENKDEKKKGKKRRLASLIDTSSNDTQEHTLVLSKFETEEDFTFE